MSLVLWSGGCDSTLVLYDLAREEGTKKKPIRAITICHNEVPAEKEQRRARKKILKEFKRRGLHVVHTEVKIEASGDFCVSGGGSVQGVIWIGAVVPYLQLKEDLYTGYVRGDCFWHFEGWAVEAFNDLKSMMYKEGKLRHPLEWSSKVAVIKELTDAKLISLTWHCEHPKNSRPCGCCDCCVAHETALWQIKKWPKHGIVEKK